MSDFQEESIAGLKDALADLTARASDHDNEGEDLALPMFAQVLDDLVTTDDAIHALSRIAFGYGNLALKLLVELERKSDLDKPTILRGLGRWIADMESR